MNITGIGKLLTNNFAPESKDIHRRNRPLDINTMGESMLIFIIMIILSIG